MDKLEQARQAITRPEATPDDFREYGHRLRLEAARLRAKAERLDSMADSTYRHAVDMPQSLDERKAAFIRSIS